MCMQLFHSSGDFFRVTRYRRSKLLIGIVIVTLILIEWFSYWLQTQRWPAVTCSNDDEYCVRVLLVADPQIIGERYEMGFPIGPLARWDSDRYLAKTFRQAHNHVRPHIVIFLGDLMDEGSVSTYAQYNRYFTRFSNIFPSELGVKVIYLPGDNDIGGENEAITHEKLTKFQDKFGQPDVTHLRGISFIKVNRLRYTVPKLPIQSFNETRIVLSHLPLLPNPSPFIEHAMSSLKPHFIITAHDHHPKHTKSGRDGRHGVSAPLYTPLKENLANKDSINEFTIPTCSYRMGVPHMGYGALTLDTRTLELFVFILWLPGRFPQLLGYVALLTFVCLFSMCLHCNNAVNKRKIHIKRVQA